MTTISRLSRLAGRVLAILCLYIGLALAARLLGAGGGGRSPIAMYGVTAFTWFSAFAIGYLFAAVGIWIASAWGYVVAAGIAFCEIMLSLFGGAGIDISMLDFLGALMAFVLAAGLFVLVEIKPFRGVND